ncbi:MAG: hypothetical protein A2046_09860 [Bacteroidetes bacterium GWA2_30_7]|nr:MAG: hypothetical protein A2046_09860 [Bacteroidetes bacterium GWA2_30_7]
MKKITDINQYLLDFPKEIQILLEQLRTTIKESAPEAEEVISYNMPALKFHGILVYYAAYKNHIGFYPTSSGIVAFKNELSSYKTSKGTVQFPLNKPLPLDLITKIVKFRIKENLDNVAIKKAKKLHKSYK